MMRTLSAIALFVGLGVTLSCTNGAALCPKESTSCSGVCVDTATDARNCGGCGKACDLGQSCVGSQCAIQCGAGTTLCGKGCVDLNADRLHCGGCTRVCGDGEVCSAGSCGLSCGGGAKKCGLKCVDVQDDPANCGDCGGVCLMGTVCVAGKCAAACPAGQSVCKGACVNLLTDAANCKTCGVACPLDNACVAGACQPACAQGQTYCNGACVNLASDLANCGKCGTACAKGLLCAAGVCGPGCQMPLVVCNNQMCVDPRNDPDNCMTCGNKCPSVPNAARACSGAVCGMGACAPSFLDCDGVPGNGCEVNSTNDLANCGGCGKACGAAANATPSCAGSTCVAVCGVGFADCNKLYADGCEVNLKSDFSNCGACGTVCPNNLPNCINGACIKSLSSFNVLSNQNIVYQGISYVLLKVSFNSLSSIAPTWCDEYVNLCASFGGLPTGCGSMFTMMLNGYGTCRSMYKSDGISNTLGCNPSGGVATAAMQAGFLDATTTNSFGFHYCDVNTCAKQMCAGNNCNTALSYIDANQPFGYTLCKK